MNKIRKVLKKDVYAFASIGANAFPGMGIHTPQEKKKLGEGLLKRLSSPGRTLYGSYAGKQLQGGLILYDFKMNMLGTTIECGGGGFLAVDLMHKKEHIGRDLCRFFFRHYRERKYAMTSLYPFRPDFYRDMGVGFGGKSVIYRFAPNQLPKIGDKSKLRELTLKDRAKITACFNAYAKNTHGMFYDFKAYREGFFRQHPKARMVGYEKNGKLLGYLVFSFKQFDSNFIRNEIHIDEWLWLNSDAFHAMSACLRSQQDQNEMIQYLTFDNSFHHFLHDPRNDSGNFYPSVNHESNTAAVGIMYRVIDTKRLFNQLKQHEFGNDTLAVCFDIKDSFLPENNKPVTVAFAEGRPKLLAAKSKADVTLAIDIADFSSLIIGAVKLSSLVTYGRAELSDISWLDRLETMLSAPKPVCWTHF